MIYCPICGTANRRGSKYCNECGVKLDPHAQVKCPKCGSLNAPTAPHCEACGEPISLTLVEPDQASAHDEGESSMPLSAPGDNRLPPWLEGIPSPLVQEIPALKGTAKEGEQGPGLAEAEPRGRTAPSATPLDSGDAGSWDTPLSGSLDRMSGGGEAALDTGIQGVLHPQAPTYQPGMADQTLPSSDASSVLPAGPPSAAELEAASLFHEIVVPYLTGVPGAMAPPEAQDKDNAPVPVESVLAIDCGSTVTRVFLIDRVKGEYRLVAWTESPSTLGPPWRDMAASVRQALDQITTLTGFRLLNDLGQITFPERDGFGVDAAVAITSASEPLRLVLAGTPDKQSLASARHALALSGASVERLIATIGKQQDLNSNGTEGQVSLFQELETDAIVLVGGQDGGSDEGVLDSVRTVALACCALPPATTHPAIIYAGNASFQDKVAQIFGNCPELQLVENVRPSMEEENPGPLHAAVERLHREQKLESLPGLGTLAAWSSTPVWPKARTWAQTIEYLAHPQRPGGGGNNILGVDVGGTLTTLVTVFDGRLEKIIYRDLGLSYNAARILDHVPVASLLDWLPSHLDPAEAQNTLHNKALRPHTLPQTQQDLFLEQAVAREILRLAAASLLDDGRDLASQHYADLTSRFDLIIGGGGVLANATSPGQAALMLLDGLQPVGIFRLALDWVGLIVTLGAVAAVNPLAAAQVAERDALLTLGTVIAPAGTADEGEIALTCKIEYQDGRALELGVPCGSLEVLPLAKGQRATLEVRPANHFSMGPGSRGRPVTAEVEGGAIGVILDARGRPLSRAEDPGAQRARMQRWLWNIAS